MHIIYLYSFHFQNSGPLITVYEKSPWVSVSNEGLGNLSSHPCPSPFFITEIVNKQVDELELDSPLNTRHLKITLKENIFTNLRESMQFYFTVLGVYFFSCKYWIFWDSDIQSDPSEASSSDQECWTLFALYRTRRHSETTMVTILILVSRRETI